MSDTSTQQSGQPLIILYRSVLKFLKEKSPLTEVEQLAKTELTAFLDNNQQVQLSKSTIDLAMEHGFRERQKEKAWCLFTHKEVLDDPYHCATILEKDYKVKLPKGFDLMAPDQVVLWVLDNAKSSEVRTQFEARKRAKRAAGDMTEKEFNAIKAQENPRLTVRLENSFVTDYIEYMRSRSDSYPEYQHGAAIALLSAVVNKRAFLELNIGIIYPNVWTFFIGLSTISRKTTACNNLADFLRLTARWMFLSYPGSPEAFIEDLEGEDRVEGQQNIGHGVLVREEAAGLMAQMEKTYMSDMRDLLCQLYDGTPFSRKLRTSQRKKKTMFVLQDPYLDLVFATTPTSFTEHSTMADLTAGWLLRFLYYYPNYARKMQDIGPLSQEDHERQRKIGQQLLDLMKEFKAHSMRFTLSPAGQAAYNAWKNQRLELMQQVEEEDRGVYDRLSIYALKLGILYTVAKKDFLQIARGLDQVAIDDACLKEACRQVDEYFLPVAKIVFEMVGKSAEKNAVEKVLAAIKRAGGKITRTRLMKNTHIRKRDFDESIESLLESNEIAERSVEGERCYLLA